MERMKEKSTKGRSRDFWFVMAHERWCLNPTSKPYAEDWIMTKTAMYPLLTSLLLFFHISFMATSNLEGEIH